MDVIDVKLSERAVKAIKKLSAKKNLANPVFRIKLIEEGCAGYKYHMEFDEKILDSDIVVDYADFKLAVDKYSYEHLKGLEIDYIENLMKPVNFIFNNPNVKKSCKCGSSYSFNWFYYVKILLALKANKPRSMRLWWYHQAEVVRCQS